MKKKILAGLAALLCLACTQKTPQDRLTVNDRKIDKIIAQMTLEEKVEMLHSKTIMSSEGVPRLGIQDIKYADGPFGVREEVADGFRPKGWVTDSATYFPTGSALAATWSKEMAYACGEGIGQEARLRGKDVMLGPAINIQRLPVGGRSYEYLSEDPVLSAALAVGYVEGMQDAGTAACIKHFAVNNQETNRGSVDAQIDERTLREIYLKPFEAAVREAGAMSVMTAYNRVNGDYCSENEHLNNEILRGDWGFKGFTVSDWGGTHSTMGAALHGLDVQMTGSSYLGPALIDSVKAGAVPESVVDDKVRELLRVRFAIEPVPEDVANTVLASRPESHQAALEIARRSIVLLKNEGNILPLSKDVKKIFIIGQNAVLKTQSGGVGAGVKSPYEVTPFDGIQKRAGDGVEITYSPGYMNYPGRRNRANHDNLEAMTIDEPLGDFYRIMADMYARSADVVIYVCGTNKNIESEGSDRKDIKLPTGQDELVQILRNANPNLVTVVISGGPCDLQEIEKNSPAIVQGWWNGIEGGTALAEVLFGDIAPSGKLPFTFPVKLEDSPAFAMGNFPNPEPAGGDLFTEQYRRDITGGQQRDPRAQRPIPVSKYTEGQLVGYRWYDTKGIKPMYAFGHGLSYVDFEYSGLKTNKKSYKAKDVIKLSFEIKNTGSMPAEEVAQAYVRRLGANVQWPVKELKAFDRIALDAGETKTVILEIPVSELRYWNTYNDCWDLEHSDLEVLVGSASDDIRLTAKVHI
jgi:beta-glucosidase